MRTLRIMAALVSMVAIALGARGAGPEDRARAGGMARKAAAYLRSQQDKSGGWAVNPSGPNFPAITGLVVSGLLLDPAPDPSDPAVAGGVKYMLTFRQPDGGIYDRILPAYNTAICLSALTKVNTPAAREAIKPAQDFLKNLQFGEDAREYAGNGDSAKAVAKDHPFYGGVGYGKHGRPDLSNLSFVLEALHDSGVEPTDASFQRALVFLSRVQMQGSINDMPYAKGSTQGGFIYSTSVNKDQVGVGQSFAGLMEETLSDGTKASRLRSYGSMTYAGFKSYVYAGLSREDPRVTAALGWISRNYTLQENPGVGPDGMYYYLVTFARALSAWGEPMIRVVGADGSETRRDWGADLIRRLGELQEPDGSFRKVDDRWMEDNSVLITAYALIALRQATR